MASSTTSLAAGHDGVVSECQLNPGEIVELADRLRALLYMVDKSESTATTAMMYRLEGAGAALDAVLGRIGSSIDSFDDSNSLA